MIFYSFVFVSYESPTYTAQAKRVNDERHKQNTELQKSSWVLEVPANVIGNLEGSCGPTYRLLATFRGTVQGTGATVLLQVHGLVRYTLMVTYYG